jgi:hypoxanthine phosphoribosyltransferase
LISTTCIVAPERFAEAATEHERKRGITINGVVIIDDIAVTGRSLSENAEQFLKDHFQFLKDRSITVVIISLLATREGDETVRKTLASIERWISDVVR